MKRRLYLPMAGLFTAVSLSGQTIGEAVDNTAVTWESDATANAGAGVAWSGQTAVSFDGSDAAESPEIEDDQASWIETTVTGPGVLEFTWKVSSERYDDFLTFYLGREFNGETIWETRDWIDGEVDWETRVFNIPAGEHVVRWTYSKDGSGSDGDDRGWVDQFGFTATDEVGLAEAVDMPEAGFVSEASPNAFFGTEWFGQTNDTFDGSDAAQAPLIGHDESTWMETEVAGPGTIDFHWKVSSERYDDILYFTIGRIFGSEVEWEYKTGIDGVVDWNDQSFEVPAGDHVLRWVYAKDGGTSSNLDTGWVDQASFTPSDEYTLGEALEQEDMTWESGASENAFFGTQWFGQDLTTLDGSDAARTPIIGHDQSTWMQTTVEGPGTIEYYWKVSSERYDDLLTFFIGRIVGEDVIWENKAHIDGDVDWDQRAFHVPAGEHLLRWQYSKDGGSDDGEDAGYVDQVSFTASEEVELAEAADAPELEWTTGASDNAYPGTGWFGQSLVSQDGQDALQAPLIDDDQSTWVAANVTGPAMLEFSWRASSERYDDILSFWLKRTAGGEEVFSYRYGIDGETDWERVAVAVPAGSHTAYWRYRKDNAGDNYEDTAWIDQVEVTPAPQILIADALDHPELQWAVSRSEESLPGEGWYGQNLVTQDGTDAVANTLLGHGHSVDLSTRVIGPGTFSFLYRLSTERYDDELYAYLVTPGDPENWEMVLDAGGDFDWQTGSFEVPEGEHHVVLRYAKDSSGSDGLDTVWIDQVSWDGDVPAQAPWYAEFNDWGDSWRGSHWFGFFKAGSAPWHYHTHHGWFFVPSTGSDSGSFWLYDPEMGWLNAANGAYPYMIDQDANWYYYFEGTSNSRWFYSYQEGDYIQIGD